MKKLLGITVLASLISTVSFAEIYKVAAQSGSMKVTAICDYTSQNQNGSWADLQVHLAPSDISVNAKSAKGEQIQYTGFSNLRIEGNKITKSIEAKGGSLTIGALSASDEMKLENLKNNTPCSQDSDTSNKNRKSVIVMVSVLNGLQVETSTLRDRYCDSSRYTVYDGFLNFTGKRLFTDIKTIKDPQVAGSIDLQSLREQKRICVSVRSVVEGVIYTVATPFALVCDIVQGIATGEATCH